jgi:hypothetical protein
LSLFFLLPVGPGLFPMRSRVVRTPRWDTCRPPGPTHALCVADCTASGGACVAGWPFVSPAAITSVAHSVRGPSP